MIVRCHSRPPPTTRGKRSPRQMEKLTGAKVAGEDTPLDHIYQNTTIKSMILAMNDQQEQDNVKDGNAQARHVKMLSARKDSSAPAVTAGATVALTPDLAFKPVETAAPKRLTPAQIDQYNAKGFVTGLQAFGAAQARDNLAYFDSLLAQAGPDGGYAVNCFQARLKGVWDLCTTPTILDHVEDIIGPNIVCWASHFFAKLPGDPKTVPWHQDASFWHLTPARTVTVWLAIDDTDEENSAMRFLPGTHDKGELEWQAAGDGNVLNKELVGTEAMGAPFSNTLKAGQFSLHADMLAHGSLPNRSDRRRCGLTIRYCPPEVSITDAAWEQGIEAIIARGEDPTGRWAHHPRPASDVFEPKSGPRNVGGN